MSSRASIRCSLASRVRGFDRPSISISADDPTCPSLSELLGRHNRVVLGAEVLRVVVNVRPAMSERHDVVHGSGEPCHVSTEAVLT
jgi:hypothetical protein